MDAKKRETFLKIAVGAVVGLFLLDWLIISPAVEGWKEQSERLALLRKDVTRGRALLEREQSLRGRWSEMQRTDLAEDGSAAESDAYKAIGRWGLNSKVSFTSLITDWRTHEDGYDTFECRAVVTGDQAGFGRLLYEIEADPLPAKVEESELSTRDAQGRQLGLTVKFSFIRITDAKRTAP
ncbi:MAG TPA: hypothetical protein VF593_05145 [Chthoniobacteraceae bacterium]|jgi:hypothetical protein